MNAKKTVAKKAAAKKVVAKNVAAKKAVAKKTVAKKVVAKKAAAKRLPKGEIKTKPTAVTIDDFLATVENPERRADAKVVLGMMRDATGEDAVMWGPSIVGFGRYRYLYDSGHGGEMCLAGFSPRKTELVVYIIPGFDAYAPLLARLGPHRIGKSCLYIKRLADIDQDALRELITIGVAAMEKQRVRSSS